MTIRPAGAISSVGAALLGVAVLVIAPATARADAPLSSSPSSASGPGCCAPSDLQCAIKLATRKPPPRPSASRPVAPTPTLLGAIYRVFTSGLEPWFATWHLGRDAS